MTVVDAAVVRALREALDRLSSAESASNDAREVVADRVHAAVSGLPRENIVAALDRAVGKSKKRARHQLEVLSSIADDPAVQLRLLEFVEDPVDETRESVYRTIGDSKLVGLANVLSQAIDSEQNPWCLDAALWAAGKLGSQECAPAVLRYAQRRARPSWRLGLTLADLPIPETRPLLCSWMRDPSVATHVKVPVAWALGKLGDVYAIPYLTSILQSSDPACIPEHFRAAQAIADLLGWPFTWSRDRVEEIQRQAADDPACRGAGREGWWTSLRRLITGDPT